MTIIVRSPYSSLSTLLSIVITLPFAVLVATFGEGVRRGWAWTRPIQIGFNTLGFLGGFFTLFNFLQARKHSNYWSLVTTIILLIFSPLIAWRISRPETGVWRRVRDMEGCGLSILDSGPLLAAFCRRWRLSFANRTI